MALLRGFLNELRQSGDHADLGKHVRTAALTSPVVAVAV